LSCEWMSLQTIGASSVMRQSLPSSTSIAQPPPTQYRIAIPEAADCDTAIRKLSILPRICAFLLVSTNAQ
jgi:hypothetical protein